MSDFDVVTKFISGCFSGALAASECGPVWYLQGIVVMVVAGIAVLIGLRRHAANEETEPRR